MFVGERVWLFILYVLFVVIEGLLCVKYLLYVVDVVEVLVEIVLFFGRG